MVLFTEKFWLKFQDIFTQFKNKEFFFLVVTQKNKLSTDNGSNAENIHIHYCADATERNIILKEPEEKEEAER